MLNRIQKEILDATLDFIFAPVRDEVLVDLGLLAIDAIFDDEIYKKHKAEFIKWQIGGIDQARLIYKHLFPQNRAVGSPYVRQVQGWVAFEPNGHNKGIVREEQGLFGLTALNNSNTSPVTRDDVVNYLKEVAETYRNALRSRISDQPISRLSLPPQLPTTDEIPEEVALTFAHAYTEFVDDMRDELIKNKKDPQKAVKYCVEVLRAIRRSEIRRLLDHPNKYGIDSDIIPFIQSYLYEHRILLSAKHLHILTRAIENQYYTGESSFLLKQTSKNTDVTISAQQAPEPKQDTDGKRLAVTSIMAAYHNENYWYTAEDINQLLHKQLKDGKDANIFAPAFPVLKSLQEEVATLLGEPVGKALEANLISVVPLNLLETASLTTYGLPTDQSLVGNHWIGLAIIPASLSADKSLQIMLIDSLGNGFDKDIDVSGKSGAEISAIVAEDHFAKKQWIRIGQIIGLIQHIIVERKLKVQAEFIITGLKQQHNSSDCGPFLVNNLVALIKEGRIHKAEGVNIRRDHSLLLNRRLTVEMNAPVVSETTSKIEAVETNVSTTETPKLPVLEKYNSPPKGGTPFWSIPLEKKAVDEEIFIRFVIHMVDELDAHLKKFLRAYDVNAALTFMGTLLRAIRKDQLPQFFDNPTDVYGIPQTIAEFLRKQLENHHYLLGAKDLGPAARDIEMKLTSRAGLEVLRKKLPETKDNDRCFMM